MKADPTPDGLFRRDCKAFLRFCEELQIRTPLSLRALDFWLYYIADLDIPDPDRKRMRTSVEGLFRHLGALPDEEAEDLEVDFG